MTTSPTVPSDSTAPSTAARRPLVDAAAAGEPAPGDAAPRSAILGR